MLTAQFFFCLFQTGNVKHITSSVRVFSRKPMLRTAKMFMNWTLVGSLLFDMNQ